MLAAWSSSPTRFREDANAEEDTALVGYPDRVLVELAQNAADAAARAGEPGRLAVRLDDGVLAVANTGAPLDAAGVASLASLRASAKRDDDPAATVGRFGVGFAAVLAVSDAPVVASTSGAVAFSADRTRAAVQALPELAAELARRDGHVPVLRLPFPDTARPPEGFTTEVTLPLRDAAAVARARAAVEELDEGLLVALPALSVIEVVADGRRRVLTGPAESDRVVAAQGQLPPGALASLPTEQRGTGQWWLRWAVPRPAGCPAVIHAPTPTTEPVDLPALLVGSFPVDAARRHLAPGPVTDLLLAEAGRAYLGLLVAAAADGPAQLLPLLPGPVGAGVADAAIRAVVRAGLADLPLGAGGVRAGQARLPVGLPAPAYPLVADVVADLLAPQWDAPGVDSLGVARVGLADLVDELAGVDRPAQWWADLYTALDGADLTALSGLPVPLVDGRTVSGPRGVLLGASGADATAWAGLGLRLAAVDHPLLARLGAVPADAQTVLDHPGVAAAVGGGEADPQLARTVLGLLARAGAAARERPWLGGLLLPAAGGGYVPAAELVLPDAVVAGWLAPGAADLVDPALVDEVGRDALVAAGVLDTFTVRSLTAVSLDPDTVDLDVDDAARWADDVLTDVEDRLGQAALRYPPLAPEMVVVADLDLVDDDAWPAVLTALAADPATRAALLGPTRLVTADGDSVDVASYTAWWLGSHVRFDGRRPRDYRLPGAPAWLGLALPAALAGVDAAVLAAVGVASSAADVADSPMLLPLLAAGVDPRQAVDPVGGAALPVPDVLARVLTGLPPAYREHDDLVVAGVAVDWWVAGDATVHAATLDGLARGCAWACGQWDARLLAAAVLAEPSRVEELLAEESFGEAAATSGD